MDTGDKDDLKSMVQAVKGMVLFITQTEECFGAKAAPLLKSLESAHLNRGFSSLSDSVIEATKEIAACKKEFAKDIDKKCNSLLKVISESEDSFPPESQVLTKFKSALSSPVKSLPEIIEATKNLASEMIFSIQTYREQAHAGKSINKNGEFKSGIDGIMLADIALATKKISRDLVKLGNQLIKTRPDCEESKSIVTEINGLMSSGSVNFFKCIDILSRITWKLQSEIERDLIKSRNGLVELATKFGTMASAFQEAMSSHSESKNNTEKFGAKFKGHLDKLNKISLNSTNIEQIKKDMFEQVEKMQQDLVSHVEVQSKIMQRQEQIIQSQSQQIGEITNKADTMRIQLSDTINSSAIDSLTGVFNRQAFDCDMHDKFLKWSETRSKFLSVAIIDLDNFKSINDTHGHLIGDDVLKHVSNVIRRRCEQYNDAKCYRFGGEEFALIIEAETPLDIIKTCRDIHSAVGNTRFISKDSCIQKVVTCSMGVEYFSENSTIATVINSADKAMYKAKNAGKNKVWLASRKTIDAHAKAVADAKKRLTQ